jgi:hypothetical protein
MIDYKTAGASIVIAVALMFAIGVGQDGKDGRDGSLGASPGPDHTETQYFLNNFTVGDGSVATTSDAATYTLTAREMDIDAPYVSWTANVNTTLTTMASTSAPFSGMRTGEMFEQIWYNASTTAAATITFAAGTGVDLQEDEGGTVIVNGLETARLTYIKKADTDIALIVEPYQVGD